MKNILILCLLLMSNEAIAANVFITGPVKVVSLCDQVDHGLQETIKGTEGYLNTQGFACVDGKSLEGIKTFFCADKEKNNLIVGIAETEKSCLLAFFELMKMHVKTGSPLPTMPTK